jgi:hypothetical protein
VTTTTFRLEVDVDSVGDDSVVEGVKSSVVEDVKDSVVEEVKGSVAEDVKDSVVGEMKDSVIEVLSIDSPGADMFVKAEGDPRKSVRKVNNINRM